MKKMLFLGAMASSIFFISPLACFAGNLDTLDGTENFVRQYYSQNDGLSLDDYTKMQKAEGLLTSRESERALDMVSALRETYPEHSHLQLLQARAYLALNEPERALLILDSLFQTLRKDDDFTAEQHFEILNLQVQAYLMQDESALALRLVEGSSLQAHQLGHSTQMKHALLHTGLLADNQRSLAAYHGLTEFLNQPGQLDDAHLQLNNQGPALAEAIFTEARSAYYKQDYAMAASLAQNAYAINPEPVKYAQLMMEAQERFQAIFAQRFRQARPLLLNSISNMRYLLDAEDYNGLYREYIRLNDNPDVKFLLRHQAYLPLNIFHTLNNIERELEAQRVR